MKIHSGALLRSIVFNCGRFSLSKYVWSMVEYVLKAFGALKDRSRLAQCVLCSPPYTHVSCILHSLVFGIHGSLCDFSLVARGR